MQKYNSQPQIKTPNYTENNIKMNEIKHNIIRGLSKVTNIAKKGKAHLKIKTKQPNADKVRKLYYRRSSTEI